MRAALRNVGKGATVPLEHETNSPGKRVGESLGDKLESRREAGARVLGEPRLTHTVPPRQGLRGPARPKVSLQDRKHLGQEKETGLKTCGAFA